MNRNFQLPSAPINPLLTIKEHGNVPPKKKMCPGGTIKNYLNSFCPGIIELHRVTLKCNVKVRYIRVLFNLKICKQNHNGEIRQALVIFVQ